MEINEIKKALYKQKPIAKLNYIQNRKAYYYAYIETGNREEEVFFEIPVSDMGDATFHDKMDAKLLIRWLLIEENGK